MSPFPLLASDVIGELTGEVEGSHMKWNATLLVVALTLLILFLGVGLTAYIAEAEVLAEELAPQLGIDEDVMREALANALLKYSGQRRIVLVSPLVIMVILLAVRMVVDMRRHTRTFEEKRGLH